MASMLQSSLLLLTLLNLSLVATEPSLRLVNVVYRHGDRSPAETFPSDKNQEDAWPRGWGQLTQIGMQMQYGLGQFLGNLYQDEQKFLNASYKWEEIYIRSTDIDRCLMSAESNLAGLYPPSEKEKFTPDIAWQPVPVHTEPKKEDYLLRAEGPDCPYYDELFEKVLDGDYVAAVNKENEAFFKELKNNTGLSSDVRIDNIYEIEDPLFCEQAHNMTLPPWVTDSVLQKLENLTNIGMTLLFSTDELARLKGGPLVGKIIQDMEDKSLNVTGTPIKFYMYSAHDTTLAAFMSALGVYNGKQSPYASTVAVELWEDSGNFSVKMWFRNSTTQQNPYRLHLPHCPETCPLHQFKSLLKHIIPDDVKAECGATHKKNYTVAILIGTSLIALILVFILIFLICRGRRLAKTDGHVRLPQDPDV